MTNTPFLLCFNIFLQIVRNKTDKTDTVGCYLTNSATLVFTIFEIFMHPTFAQCLT